MKLAVAVAVAGGLWLAWWRRSWPSHGSGGRAEDAADVVARAKVPVDAVAEAVGCHSQGRGGGGGRVMAVVDAPRL